MDHTPWKLPLFLMDMVFLVKEVSNLTYNFTSRKWHFWSTERWQGYLVSVDEWPIFGPMASVAVLLLSVAFMAHWNTMPFKFGILRQIYSLSYSVWNLKMSYPSLFWKTGQLGTKTYVKFLKKKSNVVQGPPARFMAYPAFCKLSSSHHQDREHRHLSVAYSKD
jgi:hypothetical protein